MWKCPSLTVALLTHNRSMYLREAVEGILNQTWTDFELLVLDNASDDPTPELILSFHDPRLVYIRQPPGKLSGYNWATGLWMARGEFLMVTHDDDILEPSALARQMAAFAGNPELSAVATNVSTIDTEGNLLQPRLYPWQEDRNFPPGGYLQAFLEEKLWAPMQTCLFRRQLMARLVGLGKRWNPVGRLATLGTGDILNAIQLNTHGEMLFLEEPLLRYRQHGGQEGRGIDQSRHMIALYRILRQAARTTPVIHPYRTLIEIRLARVLAQERLLCTQETREIPRLKRQAEKLFKGLSVVIPPRDRSNLLTPLEILANLLEVPWPYDSYEGPEQSKDRASEAFSAWRALLTSRGGGLFPSPPPLQRVAILGSLLVAGLLALEASRAGIEVLCFLESSPARQGGRFLGRDVHPVTWLAGHASELNAILLSSEGEGEEGIRAMLRRYSDAEAPQILSWKDLAGREGTP